MKIKERIKTSTFKERLKEIIALRGLKPIELSHITGISRSSLSEYLSGEYEPKTDKVQIISDALGVSNLWLMGYDVPMKRKQEKSYSYDDYNACISEEENPIRLEIEEYLDTFSNNDLKRELSRLKKFDKNSPDEPELTEGEKTLLEAFRKLTPKNQEIALQMILGALEAMQ